MNSQQRIIRSVIAACVVLAALLTGQPVAAASPDYSSFFEEPRFADSGWSTCAPITWSADTRGMTATQSAREIKRLRRVWSLWEQAGGPSAVYVGQEHLAYEPATYGLRATDGSAAREHHVYIAFKTRREVSIFTGGAVGLAKPTLVFEGDKRIAGGMALMLRGYVTRQARHDPKALLHVYAHELGHVLGLGHAQSRSNVMYPEIIGLTELGFGDQTGIARITQPCRA
ncbi:MAG: matrixin family metalloprotease [Actinobacteria bacterium]|nr:matrixin family metalloprotease [Actinomycetota bacterium]